MQRRLIPTIAFVLLTIISTSLAAEIRLPAILGSNMVLPQKSKVNFWGWSNPGEKIQIINSWNNQPDSATASSEGKWKVSIQTPGAGGPYIIVVKGENKIELTNILIGEVWLCSGQSNMEWSAMNNNKQALEEAPGATNTQIRFFHIPRTSAEYPQEDCRGEWKVCNPEDMKRFSAIGYFFGKKLNKELKVPVGLINSSWGGTPAETWTPMDVVMDDKDLKEASDKLKPVPWGPVAPGKLYNGMIAPITNFAITGALWYQGESNAGTAYMYTKLLSALIESWRKKWSIEFPFYFVQIAPYNYGNNLNGPLLREAQSRVKLEKTGMVVISDLVDNVNDIHPQNKLDVAIRLADMALAEHYKVKSGPYKYPRFKEMKIEKNRVRIYFENAEAGLMSRNGEVMDFTIAGEDKVFHKAIAKIEGNTVVLYSPAVSQPVAVRFGFENRSMPNLFSKEGLPVNLFRTDNWLIGQLSN